MRSINRISITDEAVSQIRAEILSGTYKVGDRLATENELAEQLGVGRSTVREAMRMLKALGFIEIRQGKGAFVAKVSEDTDEKLRDWFTSNKIRLADFMEVRMSLEPLAVKLAVERADDVEIADIEKILEVFEGAVDTGNALDLALSDEAFHTSIAEASRNNLLIMMNRTISEYFRDYRARSFAVKANIADALEPHRKIMAALKARDAVAGAREMVKHLELSMEDIDKVTR